MKYLKNAIIYFMCVSICVQCMATDEAKSEEGSSSPEASVGKDGGDAGSSEKTDKKAIEEKSGKSLSDLRKEIREISQKINAKRGTCTTSLM